MEDLKKECIEAMEELVEKSDLKPGQIVVIGCSTSEVMGEKIGTHSSEEVAAQIYAGLSSVLEKHGLYIAAQCCEHLNVIPRPKAGGSFATAVYQHMKEPVAVEEIQADAGMDIGDTLIGMHLKRVAVPVRLQVKKIGCANVVAARTRAKYIGGSRAVYDEEL